MFSKLRNKISQQDHDRHKAPYEQLVQKIQKVQAGTSPRKLRRTTVVTTESPEIRDSETIITELRHTFQALDSLRNLKVSLTWGTQKPSISCRCKSSELPQASACSYSKSSCKKSCWTWRSRWRRWRQRLTPTSVCWKMEKNSVSKTPWTAPNPMQIVTEHERQKAL